LTALYEAARTLLQKAAASNNSTELNETISSLLEMTKKLRPDELRPIYSKILVLTSVMINELLVMKNRDRDNIDINSIKQLIINWCINYFAKHEDTFDQFVNQLLNYIPPHLVPKETLSQILTDLASETGDTKYSNMASRLNRDIELKRRITELEERITELRIENLDLKEEIARLEERIAGLERMVQELLKQAGSQT
jgi:hypothetical protein